MIAKLIKKFKIWILDTFYKDFNFGIQANYNQITDCNNVQIIIQCENLYIGKTSKEDIQKMEGILLVIHEGKVPESDNQRLWF